MVPNVDCVDQFRSLHQCHLRESPGRRPRIKYAPVHGGSGLLDRPQKFVGGTRNPLLGISRYIGLGVHTHRRFPRNSAGDLDTTFRHEPGRLGAGTRQPSDDEFLVQPH